MIDWLRDMALFVAVARSKSLSKAARSIGVPISTLSRRLSELERVTGMRLLERSSRALALTEAGESYLARVRPLVEAAELAHEGLTGDTEVPRGHLRVSMAPDFGNLFLSPLFADYARRYPEVTFEFDLSPRKVDLVAEHVDVAIRIGAQPNSTLTMRKLVDVRPRLYASPEYLARAGEPRTPEMLSQHACLRLNARGVSSDWTLQRGGVTQSIAVRGRVSVNNPTMIAKLAGLGLGIAPIDPLLAAPLVASGTLVRVLPEWAFAPIPIYLLTPSRLVPAKTRVFLQCLMEHLAPTLA